VVVDGELCMTHENLFHAICPYNYSAVDEDDDDDGDEKDKKDDD
jgi:hypothetical protein